MTRVNTKVSGISRLLLVYMLLLHLVLLSLAVWLVDSRGWFAESSQASDRAYRSPFYRKTVQMHRRQDPLIPDGATIVIGDSLVQGLAVQQLGADAVNYGIAGDTTSGVLDRLRWYSSMEQARLIIIAIGINDIARHDTGETIENYSRIIAGLPEEVPVILSLVMPVDERPMGLDGYNTNIAELNAAQNDICRQHVRVHCLDMTSRIASSGTLKPDYHSGDGLHLNDAGNQLWLDALNELAGHLLAGRLQQRQAG